ncbi:RidA family protein [Rhizobium sp. RAF36]|uniref:RidA family protein n=1 Tax=Rhizobium sp. RAF36 TaxID=3233055 RepID=UPI003F9D44C0
MRTNHNPGGREPSTYTHGVEVRGEARTLYVSGQIGTAADGAFLQGISDQSNAVFENLKAVLKEAGMGFEHLVKTTVFLTSREDFPAFAEVRKAHLGAYKPASTLVIVSGLVHPDVLVEVEAIAVASP